MTTTSGSSLLEVTDALPGAADEARGQEVLSDLRAALGESEWRELAATDAFGKLAISLTGNSPFMTRTCLRYPTLLPSIASSPPTEAFEASLNDITKAADAAASFDDLMSIVRKAKSEVALRAAAADIAGLWSLEQVTGSLTQFADTVLEAGFAWALRRAKEKGDIISESVSTATSGLVVLAMGKYGSGELNYSSDIDIVVFYEPGTLALKEGLDESTFFVRLTKDIVKLMQERTADGYVFRTDLRLRPDPGGTRVAVSLPAAEQYYESRGQNWERAAYIKARPAACDIEAGQRFLSMLSPFIWRKYLDYAAIEDVHSMKRQIHAVGGHSTIAVEGHNIKLGRGGIREIEFFVQTQQLIAGGRDEDLRGMQTVPMLGMLVEKEWIEPSVADEMKAAYRFLRTLEHRLQMIDDEQTHSLPSTAEGIEHVACFMGYADRDAFEKDLLHHLTRVQTHYMALFETAPPLGEEGGSLVFTGTDDDPETLATLSDLGFDNVTDMSATIRGWHTGRFSATRSPRSRERLTALMPELLRALSRTAEPDIAFLRFDQFLSGLPAGVQLFSLLYANPSLLSLIAEICGTAPRLATYLSQNAGVLDAVLSPSFFSALPDETALETELADALSSAEHFEDVLDFARVWAREQRFRLGVRVLSASANAREAGPAYSAVATALIRQMQTHVARQIENKHGRMASGEMAVIAMGKLGSREMSAASDLDIITIYDLAEGVDASDGKKSLVPSQYYARLTQQLVSALTAPTAEGKLYEVDLRLRPSGNAGPVASQLASFDAYQAESAWTWEHMALTRARVVSGAPDIVTKIEAIIRATLTQERDADKTATDVRDMRARIEKEFGTKDPWSLKQVRGGLIDLEFIAQYLQLVHAHVHPEILTPDTRSVFSNAARLGLIDQNLSDALQAAFDLQHDLTHVLRICVTGDLAPETATESLKMRLAQAGNAPDFAVLQASLIDAQADVIDAYAETIGEPAS
ncbi:MAG: bifunctional [glutamine synthetase] adenylyltransferase/[glutamine synthetase]-adenylyl-L-tyrosine phosphorylase [Rhodobiaceae bacterium]|nr:bifunctional [glutamine synthetase] adenylyltransferase/[glutamine synthetase]-adenylyl-L-tyrosine phosphorylase [Rhodobiaceae bacterium]